MPLTTVPTSDLVSGRRTALKLFVDGSWSGWDGDTVVQLTDGSVWHQDDYRYAYRHEVNISSGKMMVKGMRRAIRVRRLS